MQSRRNALIFIVITYRVHCQIRSLCHMLYNHAENFRPFPQNSTQVSECLQYNCIREGWKRLRQSFWLPAFCLPNNLKKRLPGRTSKSKVVYRSRLKYKWLNSYPRNLKKKQKNITWRTAKNLVFRNAEDTCLMHHLLWRSHPDYSSGP